MTAEITPFTPFGQRYIAIIGDLRHSRRFRSRAELQKRILAAIDFLNPESVEISKGQESLAAPIAMTAGDEIQSLLFNGIRCVPIINRLSDDARPASFTFGIGLGTISTELNDNVALIDGPAFHNARDALQLARQKGYWAAALGFGSDDDIITAILSLMGSIRAKWTDRQIYFMEQLRSQKSQTEIANGEGISPSVVSESLRAAADRPYAEGNMALLQLFNRHLPVPTP